MTAEHIGEDRTRMEHVIVDLKQKVIVRYPEAHQ